jgi:elongation factor G
LKEKFNVAVDTENPKIPYRETLRKSAEGQGKYKKQTGGRGQYGDVWLRLEPQERGSEDPLEFVDAIVGGVVPSKFIPAVEKGIRGALEEGAIAGYPVVDVKVTLYDGSFHAVDSSEMAFKIAASMGFKKTFKACDSIILEPIYDIEVTVPEDYMGDVMGDISGRRGKIQGMDSEGKFQVIKAKVPLAELQIYSIQLRSMTSGRGIFRMKFSHYDPVPGEVQSKLVADYEARKEEGAL